MRGYNYLVLLSLMGIAPAVSVQAADNRCAYLETQGDCICAIPQEWVVEGVVGRVSGDAMVTGPAGFSTTPGADGTTPVSDPGTIINTGNATLTMGECVKALPQNVTVYIEQKGENCECAHVVERGVIPWFPALATFGGVIIIVTTTPGNTASE